MSLIIMVDKSAIALSSIINERSLLSLLALALLLPSDLALIIVEAGELNDRVIEESAEDKEDKPNDLNPRVASPALTVSVITSMEDELERPDDDSTAGINECAVDASEVFCNAQAKEVVERDREEVK